MALTLRKMESSSFFFFFKALLLREGLTTALGDNCTNGVLFPKKRCPSQPSPGMVPKPVKCEGKKMGSCEGGFPRPQRDSASLPAPAVGLRGKKWHFLCGLCHISDQRRTLTFPPRVLAFAFIYVVPCLVPAVSSGLSSPQQAQGGVGGG